MSVNYFNKFPKVFFDVNNDGNFSILTDITKTVDINTFDEDSVTYYTFQEIGDGERPDSLSYRLYGTPQYYWTFFVINDSLKAGLGNAWPLNSHAFENMMANEYDDYSAITFDPVLHNSLTDGQLTEPAAEQMRSDFSVVPLVPINDLLTPIDDQDQYLPYLRLSAQNAEAPTAKILKYDNATCQLVVYDIRDNVKTTVHITNGGSGYGSVPTVTFGAAPSGGTTATGIAVVGSQGNISSVFVTNPGSGYVTPPTVTFSSEHASLNIFGTAFEFGDDPLDPPIAIPDTDNPPTAIFRARIPGAAGNNIRIKFNGTASNEFINPPVSITSVVVSGTDITINYYPTESGSPSPDIVKAALRANAQANALVELIIQPSVTPEGIFLGEPFWPNVFTSLSTSNTLPPTGTAVIGSQGSVTSVVITSSDTGFIPAPTVTFGTAPTGGTTATGLAVVGATGSVTSVVITNPGSGYVTNPTVTFGAAPAGGTTATGTCDVSKPVISRESLLNAESFKLIWVNPYRVNPYLINPYFYVNPYDEETQKSDFDTYETLNKTLKNNYDSYEALKDSYDILKNNNEALKERFVTAALAYFEPIDRYYYPGRVSDPLNNTDPTYDNSTIGRERYIFDKSYLKVPNTNSKVYSWELYRNATAQYTSTQTITIDGENVTTTIPVSVYDVLYPPNDTPPPPIDVLSFYEKEENANNDKRNIKIIRPEVINRFSKTYFDLLNT